MNTNFIRATKGYSSGKYYHESKVNDITSGCASYLCNRDHDISTGLNSIGYYADKDYPGIYIDNVLVHDTESYTSGDTIGTLLDLDSNTVSFYKNNELIKTVDSHLIGEVYPAIVSSTSSLDVYTTFGYKEFSLSKEQWGELTSQGVIPYDEPSALWIGKKEYNNKAIYLNGEDSYISIPHNAKQRPTDKISGGMFVYIDKLVGDKNTLLEYGSSGGMQLYINSNEELVFNVMRGSDTAYGEIKYLLTKPYRHMFIGFSYDGQVSRLFVDNKVVVEKDWGDIKTIKPGINTPLCIGKDPMENRDYYSGTVDEVSLFNKGMTEEEFMFISGRKIGSSTPSLIGLYNFNEELDGVVNDVSPSNLNGTLNDTKYVNAEINLLEPIDIKAIHVNNSTPWVSDSGNIVIKYDTFNELYSYEVFVDDDSIESSTNNTKELSISILISSLSVGDNIIRVNVSYGLYTISNELVIVKEDRDTFTFKRKFDFKEDYMTDPSIDIVYGEGVIISDDLFGEINISIPTEGKSSIESIITEGVIDSVDYNFSDEMIYVSDLGGGSIYECPINGDMDLKGMKFSYIGTKDMYLGKVNNIITGNELVSKLGITQGTQVTTDDITWLNYMTEEGEELLVADRNIRHSISYDHLEGLSIVKTLSIGYDPSLQGKIIDINGKKYKVRLLTGGNTNPATVAGGEWDRFIVKFTPDNADSNWSGIYTWCQEVFSGNPTGRVLRGNYSVVYFNRTTSSNSDAIFGFRPVLVAL